MQEFILQITSAIQANIDLAPWILFGALMLAGFNIPISEDLMLFTAGVLAAENPHMTWPLFAGVFLGAYLSDLVCYAFMGRYLGQKIFNIPLFASMVTPERIKKINQFYERYGVLTLIFGRFIPFGVRNGLFFTAGLGRMNALKFALSDLLACIISCSFFFFLYYHFGQEVVKQVKRGNLMIFAVALLVVLTIAFKRSREKKKAL